MTRPTHRLGAGVAGVIASDWAGVGPEESLMIVLVAMLFGMAPDQAELHRDSRNVDSGWCEHRTVTHGLPVALVVGWVTSWFAAPAIVMGVLAGWSSHTLLDSPTRSGSALLWPLVRRPVFLAPDGFRLKVGTWPETLIVLPALAVALWMLVQPLVAEEWHAWAVVAFAFVPRLRRLRGMRVRL